MLVAEAVSGWGTSLPKKEDGARRVYLPALFCVCAFFSSTCFFGFLTFFLPLVPMCVPPSAWRSSRLVCDVVPCARTFP